MPSLLCPLFQADSEVWACMHVLFGSYSKGVLWAESTTPLKRWKVVSFVLPSVATDIYTEFLISVFVFLKFFWFLEKTDANKTWSKKFFLLSSTYKHYIIILNHGPISSLLNMFVCLPHVLHFRSFIELENFKPGRTLKTGNFWFYIDTFLLSSGLVLG